MSILKNLIIDYFMKHKLTLIIYFLLMFLIYPLESILVPNVLSNLINSVRNETNKSFFKFFGKNTYEMIIIFAIVTIITLLLNMISNRIESYHIPNYLSFTRHKMFKKTMDKSSENFKELETGKIISKIFEVSKYMKDLMHFVLGELGPLMITIASVNIYYFTINKTIGIVLLTFSMLIIYILYSFSESIIKISSKREKELGEIFEKLNENFKNLFNIHINNQSGIEIQKFNDSERKYTDIYVRQMKGINTVSNLSRFILSITYVIIIYLGYQFIKKDKISKTQFLSIVFILSYYISNMDTLVKYGPRIGVVFGVIDNSKDYLVKLFQNNVNDNKMIKFKTGLIEFRNVEFKYPNTSKFIYKNFNIKIYPNKTTGILGRSGSGKTTFAKILLKINKISKGNIFINNINIKRYNTKYLRKSINYINQKTHLFNKNIIYNLSYGNNVKPQKIINLLKKYNLYSIYDGLDNGVLNMAGVNGSNLSLGMQKVTILIRGLLKKSSVIILDEPLAGLDKTTRVKVIKLIKDMCKNITTIIITHDIEILDICNKIINLDNFEK